MGNINDYSSERHKKRLKIIEELEEEFEELEEELEEEFEELEEEPKEEEPKEEEEEPKEEEPKEEEPKEEEPKEEETTVKYIKIIYDDGLGIYKITLNGNGRLDEKLINQDDINFSKTTSEKIPLENFIHISNKNAIKIFGTNKYSFNNEQITGTNATIETICKVLAMKNYEMFNKYYNNTNKILYIYEFNKQKYGKWHIRINMKTKHWWLILHYVNVSILNKFDGYMNVQKIYRKPHNNGSEINDFYILF